MVFLFMFVLLGEKGTCLIEVDTQHTASLGVLMALTCCGPRRGMLHMRPSLLRWPDKLTASPPPPLPASKANDTNSSLLFKTIYTTILSAIRWDYEPKQELRGSDSRLTRSDEYFQLRAKLLTSSFKLQHHWWVGIIRQKTEWTLNKLLLFKIPNMRGLSAAL